MSEIYSPKKPIAVALSFEGIVNNGATECGLTSINAYNTMHPDRAFYPQLVSATDFGKIRNDPYMLGFLALRPLVKVAEDYHTVIDLIRMYPMQIGKLFQEPANEQLAHFFEEQFERVKEATKAERDAFGKGKESAFYKERERLKKEDVFAWMNTQEPYQNTMVQLRKLADTRKFGADGKIVSGFNPYFATSKDEESTYQLCVAYRQAEKLQSGDVEGKLCVIPRPRIIGIETVPSKDKIETLRIIAEKEDIPHSQVWRVNDMVVDEEITNLYDNGFGNIFVVTGGYVFPYQIDQVKKDKRVVVLEKDTMAEELSRYAQAWGF